MTLYKLYWKIVRKNRTGILVYFFVFIAMSFLTTLTMSNNSDLNFETADTIVCIRNNDKDTDLVAGLTDYLDENITIVDAPDEDELRDALFFRAIEYSVIIPENFTEDFLNNSKTNVKKTCINKSYGSYYVDSMIDNYLNTYKTLAQNAPSLSKEELSKQVKDILKVDTKTTIYAKDSGDEFTRMNTLFNLTTYSAIACLIMAISAINFSFYEKNSYSRNIIAPITPKVFTYKLLFANCSLTGFAWLVHLALAFILCGKQLFTFRGLLLGINLLLFMIVSLAISTLVVGILKKRSSVHFAANTIGLGISFLCGSFVPQSMLGTNVLRVSQFTPGYWFVHANNLICSVKDFSSKNLTDITFHFAMILLFTAAFFAIALLLSKHQSKDSESVL